MQKLYLLLIFGLLNSAALGMSVKNKRQSSPNNSGQGQVQDIPNKGQILNQGQIPNQGVIPYQGQISNQGQSPNQGQIPKQNLIANQTQTSNQFNQTQQQTNTTDASATQISQLQEIVYQNCIIICPVTSEYNPVCGTDGVTYTNPGRLICAQNCGKSVVQLRTSRCPEPTDAPSTS